LGKVGVGGGQFCAQLYRRGVSVGRGCSCGGAQGYVLFILIYDKILVHV